MRQELTGFDTQGELDTKGSVLQIGDGVARVYGMRDAESRENWLSLKRQVPWV